MDFVLPPANCFISQNLSKWYGKPFSEKSLTSLTPRIQICNNFQSYLVHMLPNKQTVKGWHQLSSSQRPRSMYPFEFPKLSHNLDLNFSLYLLLLHKSIDASNKTSNSPFGSTGTTHLGLLIISSNLASSVCGKSGSCPSSSSSILESPWPVSSPCVLYLQHINIAKLLFSRLTNNEFLSIY